MIIKLLDEMTVTDHTKPNHIFKADMLLSAICIDSYFFQRDVRGYSPEETSENVFSIFIVE